MSQHHRLHWTATDLATWKPRIAATLPAPCTKCGRIVTAQMSWQVDHIVPLSAGGTKTAENLGPAHRKCNASHGGKLGAALTNAKRKKQKRLPLW